MAPTDRVLLLSPSKGLGGGIERYVETLESGFAELSVPCRRLDLAAAGIWSHLRMLAAARRVIRTAPRRTRLVVAHRALLPVATLLAREPAVAGISVLCHGSEAWGGRFRPRRLVERGLMKRPGLRVVAASNFTAGTLAADCQAVVLHPGLSQAWFKTLMEAGASAPTPTPGIRVVTSFRLASWREKGLGELVVALSRLGRRDIHLLVCGAGEPPADLLRLVAGHDWCTIASGISDRELAHQLAAADLFVLATRTRPGRRPSGEGFGLVLLESQVAGTAVVVPAHGGSCEAYIEGITGVAPTDESVEALAGLLASLFDEPDRLAWMGKRAAEWARESFAPERYARLAVRRLL